MNRLSKKSLSFAARMQEAARARLRGLRERTAPLLARIEGRVQGAWEMTLGALRWLNRLDIPLSPLQWILLLYIVFGVAYALASPVFEAHDELWHFGYLRHLRETGGLPEQVFDGEETLYAEHGSQPPLYYGLMALLSSPFPIDDAEDYRKLNPHVQENKPEAYGNKNLVVHDESLMRHRGTGLVVMLMRFMGLALGLGTIVLVYKIGEFIAPQRPIAAFVAAAITGLNPMFIFISASVSNDSLAMLVNAALVLSTLRCLRDGFDRNRSLTIACLFAIASITKVTSLVLLPVILGVGAYVFIRGRDRRGAALYFSSLVLFWLVIAGWWHLRNWVLYGEPFGMMTMANIAGTWGMNFSIADLLSEFQRFRMSYWGLFGVGNIQLSAIFYLLLDLMSFISVIGCVFLILQLLAISDLTYARYELIHLMALAIACVLLWCGALYWSSLTHSADGRVLFPLIAVTSPILAVGFVETVWWIIFIMRPSTMDFVRPGDAVPKEYLRDAMVWQSRILGIFAMLAPLTVIAGQYAAPHPLLEAPAKAQPVYAKYGDVALIAYERVDRRYSPGDRARIKLYWRVLAQSEQDNSIILTLVDDKGQKIGRYATYPGAGSLRTSRWKAGAIYADEYLIGIHSAATGRYPFELRVEWENLDGEQVISASNDAGDAIGPVSLDIGAIVSVRSQDSLSGYIEIPSDQQPNFDGSIRLQSFFVDVESNEISLHWKTETAPAESYTVFLHMVDEAGGMVAQADSRPRLPTKYWRWGESYTTEHRLPEEWPMRGRRVLVGWYLNDGASHPKLEYQFQDEGEEVFADSYAIPWDIYEETVRATADAQSSAETEDSEAAESNDNQAATEPANSPAENAEQSGE